MISAILTLVLLMLTILGTEAFARSFPEVEIHITNDTLLVKPIPNWRIARETPHGIYIILDATVHTITGTSDSFSILTSAPIILKTATKPKDIMTDEGSNTLVIYLSHQQTSPTTATTASVSWSYLAYANRERPAFPPTTVLGSLLKDYLSDEHIDIPTASISDIAEAVHHWSEVFQIDPLLILAVIRHESRFNQYAVSPAGASGLMQLKPSVYKSSARFLGLPQDENAIFDIWNNVGAGTHQLWLHLRRWGYEFGALCGYLLGDTGYLGALLSGAQASDSIGTKAEHYAKTILNTRDKLRNMLGLPPYREQLSVYISPGHGTFSGQYYDTGAIYGQITESSINLAISLKLKQILEENGIKVYMARERENDPLAPYLQKRVRDINTLKPTLVISIHANYIFNTSVRGYEIYYRKGFDRWLANAVFEKMKNGPIPANKTPQYMKLIILSGWPPSVLIETGYLSNAEDRAILTSEDGQWQIARAIADGILLMLNHATSEH